MKRTVFAALFTMLGTSVIATDNLFAAIKTYNRADFSQVVTDCDRLAGHPSDPDGVTSGVSQSMMDKPAAIAACHAALEKDPENPRLNYQLARAYGYSGRHAEGQPFREKALNAGYPQSLFVIGYIRIEGWDGGPKQPCYGGELVRRSAQAGRFAGLVGFPHYALTGQFDGCSGYPRLDKDEMLAFLQEAENRASGYYQQILVRQLMSDLKAEMK